MLDIILIFLLLINIIFGYKKGCIKVLSRLISVIVAFIMAYMFANTVGNYVWNNTIIGEKIEISVNSIVEKYNSYDSNVEETESNSITEFIQNSVSNGKTELVMKINNYLSVAIGFVITFFLVRIVLFIVVLILEGVFELPILKTFNKLGGAIISIVIFVIEISIILAIINFASGFEFMNPVVTFIQNSVITSKLYEHNIVTNIILNKII